MSKEIISKQKKKDLGRKRISEFFDNDETRSYSDDAPKVAEAASAWRHHVDVPDDDDRLFLLISFHFFFFLPNGTIGGVRTRGHQMDGNRLLQQSSRLRADWRTSTSWCVGHPGRRVCDTSRRQRRCRQRPQAGEIHTKRRIHFKKRRVIMKNDLVLWLINQQFLHVFHSFPCPSLKC